jgi:succinoglycan biosynthesis transport protein ExoP
MLTPGYKSEARVLVEGRENIFLRPEAEKALIDRGTVDPEAVTSQVQLVLSRDLAREVINELRLVDLPEFNAALRDFSPLSVLRTIGLMRDPMAMTAEERVLVAYFERLSAYAIDKSRVIIIEFQSSDPELAARTANLIAEKYLTMQQMAKQDQARSAGQWLSGELGTLRQKVSEAEARVEEFRARSNLFVGTNNTSLSNQQLTELSSQVSAARAQKADAEARARLIREAIRAGLSLESSDVGNSELIRRLSEQRVTLRAQFAEQSSTLLPQHPRIKELRAQIGDLDQQIRTEGERLARSLENDAKVAGARLETLSANLDQLKRQTASSSDQDVQLRGLEREAKAQRDLFESYLAKYREASARDSIAAAPADARIISRAVVSNVPYFPKKIPIMLIAVLATFCLSTGFVVTGALLRGETYDPVLLRIDTPPLQTERRAAPERSPEAHTRATDPPAPPAHALLQALSERVAATAPVPPAASSASIEELAKALGLAGAAARRIAVIGAGREVGTTLTAIALARTLAGAGRVVLVDLALNSPNIEVISSDPAAPGIADLVRGTASFGDIITRDQFSRVHVVAAGRIEGDPNALLSSAMLAGALGALAQSYDYLVVDAGALPEMPIAPLVPVVSRAALVGGDATADALLALSGQLRAQGFTDVTVLTGPPPRLGHTGTHSAAA